MFQLFRSPNPRTLHAAHRGGLHNTITSADGISQHSLLENTLAAYRYAVDECGTQVLEVDPWLTKDEVVVLNHDGVWNNMTIAEHTLAQLTHHQPNGVSDEGGLTSLEHMLSTALPAMRPDATQQLALFIDLKHIPAIPHIHALLVKYDWLHRCIYGAVDAAINRAAAIALATYQVRVPLTADIQTMKEITTAYTHGSSSLDGYMEAHSEHAAVGWFVDPGNNMISSLLTADFVQMWHAKYNRLVFLVGAALDDPEIQRKYVGMGVDALFVDRPRVLRQTLSTLDELQAAGTQGTALSNATQANQLHARYANGQQSARQHAEQRLQQFIDQYVVQQSHQPVVDLTSEDIDELKFDVEGATDFNPQLSLFNSKDDTMLYGHLLTAALLRDAQPELPLVLIDLGCGSCIPSLMALMRSKRTNVHVIGVDVDESALEVSRRNADQHHVGDQYTLIHSTMDDFLSSYKFDASKRYLVCTNPPYIATQDLSLQPQSAAFDARHWLPVDGGIRGDKFLRCVYDRDYSADIDLSFAIMWTSLSDPNAILDCWKQRNYEVTYATAAITKFGKYTTDPLLNPYLLQLREQGHVVFEGTDQPATQTHTILGILLTRP